MYLILHKETCCAVRSRQVITMVISGIVILLLHIAATLWKRHALSLPDETFKAVSLSRGTLTLPGPCWETAVLTFKNSDSIFFKHEAEM